MLADLVILNLDTVKYLGQNSVDPNFYSLNLKTPGIDLSYDFPLES